MATDFYWAHKGLQYESFLSDGQNEKELVKKKFKIRRSKNTSWNNPPLPSDFLLSVFPLPSLRELLRISYLQEQQLVNTSIILSITAV